MATTCPHGQSGCPPFCPLCLAARQATFQAAWGYTLPSRTEDRNMQRYLRDEQVKTQQDREMRILSSLGSEQTLRQNPNDGVAALLVSCGQQQLPASYPYPTSISELDGLRVRTDGDVNGQRHQQQSQYPHHSRPEPRRRSSNFTQYINPGPPDRGLGRENVSGQFNRNSTHTRRPLRSITGTSTHNSRNSRSKSNHGPEVERGEDSGDGSDE